MTMGMEPAKRVTEDATESEARERPLAETVLNEIAQDAQRDPEAYLEQTRVPEGGE